jgi:hypothetical protein
MAMHSVPEQNASERNAPERKESLWWLTVSPCIWVGHFLACYITVALWCEKLAGPNGKLDSVVWLALGYTALALAGIGATGVHAYRRYQEAGAHIANDFDTPEARHRFLGFAGLLLAAMSALAVVYVALPFGFLTTCR